MIWSCSCFASFMERVGVLNPQRFKLCCWSLFSVVYRTIFFLLSAWLYSVISIRKMHCAVEQRILMQKIWKFLIFYCVSQLKDQYPVIHLLALFNFLFSFMQRYWTDIPGHVSSIHTNYYKIFGFCAEGSGQNFVDEDNQTKPYTESRVKRLKTALPDSWSSNASRLYSFDRCFFCTKSYYSWSTHHFEELSYNRLFSNC